MRALLFCCVSLTLVALGNAQCNLPSDATIKALLRIILINVGGESPSISLDVSRYHYTCQAIHAYNLYRELSLIIEYTRVGQNGNLHAQIQFHCVDIGANSFEWDSKSEFTQRNNDELFSLTTRVNCSACARSLNENSHCTACHSDCLGVDLGACTGSGATECCSAFDAVTGDCIASCPMNYSPNGAFVCACSLECPSGNTLLTNNCTCQETHICLVDDPCQNGGNCTIGEGNGNYTCNCLGDFSGENCTVCSKDCPPGFGLMVESCSCFEAHICLLDDPCQNGGNCTIHEGDGNYTCNCPVNYSEKNCTECSMTCQDGYKANNDCTGCVLVNICLSDNPCENQGQCILLMEPDQFQCECVWSYTGDTCTECGINCDNGGTVNSNCTSCVCSSRYTGNLCEEEISYCNDNKCGIYGTCVSDYEAKGYTCSCNEGWEGPQCKQCSIDNCIECTSDPPVCTSCEENYIISASGRACDPQDLCSLAPCENGGECKGIPGSYLCRCTEEWSGNNCTECRDGYGRNNESCVACHDSQCVNCADDFSTCKRCNNGYTTGSRGQCISRPSTTVLIWIIIGSIVGGFLVLILIVIIVMGLVHIANGNNEKAKRAKRKSMKTRHIVTPNPLYISKEELNENE